MRRLGVIEAMPGDLLRMTGKVLVIGGVGLAAAVVFGGALALGSVLGAIASVTAGAACLVASSSVHRRAIEACYSDGGAIRRDGGTSIAQPIGPGGEARAPRTNIGLSPQMGDASETDEDAAVCRFVEQLEAERRNATLSERVH